LAGHKALRLTNDQGRAAQNVPFGRDSGCHAHDQVADHIGGYLRAGTGQR
jgi:hypothetical protein